MAGVSRAAQDAKLQHQKKKIKTFSSPRQRADAALVKLRLADSAPSVFRRRTVVGRSGKRQKGKNRARRQRDFWPPAQGGRGDSSWHAPGTAQRSIPNKKKQPEAEYLPCAKFCFHFYIFLIFGYPVPFLNRAYAPRGVGQKMSDDILGNKKIQM